MATGVDSLVFDFCCPDCDRPVRVTAKFRSVIDRAAKVAEVRVEVDTDSAVAHFTEHVRADPEAHPSFATPVQP